MATNERSTDAIAARPIFKAPAVRSWTTKLARFARYKPLGAAGGAILLTWVLVAVFAPYIATTAPRSRTPTSVSFLPAATTSSVPITTAATSLAASSTAPASPSTSASCRVHWQRLRHHPRREFGLLRRLVRPADTADCGRPPRFPSIVLAMVLVVALAHPSSTVTLAIGLVLIPRMTPSLPFQRLSVKEEVYVTAAQAIGCSGLRIVAVTSSPTPWPRLRARHRLPGDRHRSRGQLELPRPRHPAPGALLGRHAFKPRPGGSWKPRRGWSSSRAQPSPPRYSPLPSSEIRCETSWTRGLRGR